MYFFSTLDSGIEHLLILDFFLGPMIFFEYVKPAFIIFAKFSRPYISSLTYVYSGVVQKYFDTFEKKNHVLNILLRRLSNRLSAMLKHLGCQ